MVDRKQHRGIAALILGVAAVWPISTAAIAEDTAPAFANAEMDACLACHDESANNPVLPILATAHATKADARTPLAQTHECQTCHGPSAAHLAWSGAPPAIVFGPEMPAASQDAVCLTCHQGGNRIGWQASEHAASNVSCVSCHSIHVKEDRVMVKNRRPDHPARRPGQTAVCFQCHQGERAEIHKASSHPLRDGLMACSDCHDSHGSIGEGSLIKPTLNETCYSCHAEKRGPFAWEHAPVAEDCSLCHTPHGSNHPSLLTARGAQLCQRCHAESRHPSTAYEGPDKRAMPVINYHIGSKGCMNCHPEVHGSNHPSGSRLSR